MSRTGKKDYIMEEGKVKNNGEEISEKDEIFSKAVRAGKRTYFFDVKATRRNDYYLTITESKKRYQKDGRFFYEKHKIFLYKEDFEKFLEGLNISIDYIGKNSPAELLDEQEGSKESLTDYTDVDFDDLEKVEATQSDDGEGIKD